MKSISFLSLLILLVACGEARNGASALDSTIQHAKQQLDLGISMIESSGKFMNPVTLQKDSSIYYCDIGDWRSGFYPGTLWYLYELTGDTAYLPLVKKYTEAIGEAQNITWNHDIGFIIECSFGNALRLTKDTTYERVIVKSAQSLATRFRPVAGIIQSWNVDGGWMSKRGWECPVIIDNMMNLELLFHATKLTGDSTYYHLAVSHANRTLKEHFRPDGSSYHVVDYSLKDGFVRRKQTAQGYADESTWSRGQAWAIYGYAVCYRETGNRKYLDQAIKTFKLMKNHPAMPADCIPYWDMDASDIPNAPRDASSAACIASALYEMSTFDLEEAVSYKEYADKIVESLSLPTYLAKVGTNGHFLLMHSVGSIPHGAEIDVPLNYADYYFMEALTRKRNLEKE